jgi:hypothetical protein
MSAVHPPMLSCCHQQPLLHAGKHVDPCDDMSCDKGTKCVRGEACGPGTNELGMCEVSCVPNDAEETLHITGMASEEPSTDSSSSGIVEVPGGGSVPLHATPSSPKIVTVPSTSSPASNTGSNAAVNSAAGSNSCPDGSPPVNCLVDPCAAFPCLKGTLCVSNYCGGEQAACRALQCTNYVRTLLVATGSELHVDRLPGLQLARSTAPRLPTPCAVKTTR